jgi:DNA-binding transcriptional regulator YdaS (Cro superfamily)
MTIAAPERDALAELAGVDPAYLYQCLTGRRAMKPEEAVRVERVSGRALRRWDLRPHDWHRIWPELIGIDGAPECGEPA